MAGMGLLGLSVFLQTHTVAERTHTMKTRYYVCEADSQHCAVYMVDDEWLAHVLPDWEAIEAGPSRKWTTASKREAKAVAARYKGYGCRVASYTVTGKR
jgi:hypothetical protein